MHIYIKSIKNAIHNIHNIIIMLIYIIFLVNKQLHNIYFIYIITKAHEMEGPEFCSLDKPLYWPFMYSTYLPIAYDRFGALIFLDNGQKNNTPQVVAVRVLIHCKFLKPGANYALYPGTNYSEL